MIKKIFFLAFICALVSCQKEAVQLDGKELSTSYKLSSSSDFKNLPAEVQDIISNGGAGHFSCEATTGRKPANLTVFGSGSSSLGAYAYPFSFSMNPVKLFNSSLPCQPGIPYFIFSHIEGGGEGKVTEYTTTFRLVLNPSFFDSVKVVDVEWDLNGQTDPLSLQSLTIDELQAGNSNTVSCRVYSTDNNISVYSQEMTFDFNVLIDVVDGATINFESGSQYACTNTGIFPIVAP